MGKNAATRWKDAGKRAEVRIRLSGSLHVSCGELGLEESSFPGRQSRLVFAYLVVAHSRPVPRDELGDALWGEAPPPTWEKALVGIVSKLRVVLGEAGLEGAISNAFGCYQLQLPEGSWIDVEAARRELEASDAMFRTGDFAAARSHAEEAATLARRRFLPGEDGFWVEAKRRELETMLVGALDGLADASLAIGKLDEATRWAAEAVELEPLREAGYQRLMRAYVAAENPAGALRAYEQCRRLLADELGAHPSTATQAIHLEILRGNAAAPDHRARNDSEPPADAQAQGAIAAGESDAGRFRQLLEPAQEAEPKHAAMLLRRMKALKRQILNHDPAMHAGRGNVASEAVKRQRPRNRFLLIALALLLAVGAGAVAVTLIGTSGAASKPIVGLPDSVGLFDPATRRLVVDIPTGGFISLSDQQSFPAIAVGLGSIWVCNNRDGTVIAIDPKTHAIKRTIGLGAIPEAIAVGHGYVWIEPRGGKELIQLDSLGNIVNRIPLPGSSPFPLEATRAPVSVASGPTAIWAVHGLDSVAKIDPRSGRVLHDTRGLGGTLLGEILPTDSAVWLAVAGEGQALRLDPGSGAVEARTDPVGGVAAAWWEVASGAGGIWVTDVGDDLVWRINPTTGHVDGSVTVDHAPQGIAVRDGSVWVAGSLAGTIDQIDPVALRVTSRTAIGGHPNDFANGPGGIWVTFGDQ